MRLNFSLELNFWGLTKFLWGQFHFTSQLIKKGHDFKPEVRTQIE